MSTDLERSLEKIMAKSKVGKGILEVMIPIKEDVTDVDTVRNKLELKGRSVERSEVIELFKEVDRNGLGRYVIGRRGRPTRLEWARTVLEGHRAMQESPSEDAAETIRHRYVLRPDFDVEFDLPSDLTKVEAKRLSEFITTLPFGIGKEVDNNGS